MVSWEAGASSGPLGPGRLLEVDHWPWDFTQRPKMGVLLTEGWNWPYDTIPCFLVMFGSARRVLKNLQVSDLHGTAVVAMTKLQMILQSRRRHQLIEYCWGFPGWSEWPCLAMPEWFKTFAENSTGSGGGREANSFSSWPSSSSWLTDQELNFHLIWELVGADQREEKSIATKKLAGSITVSWENW